jgi:ketosteroid isomerase-like protein
MSTDENKALVRRFYAEIDKGNLAAMDELVAEKYLDHHPPPFPGLRHGREGVKQAFQIFWAGTPGYHRIDDQIAEGDKVVTRLTAIGKHEGDLPGSPHRRWQAGREVVGERSARLLATDRRDARTT